MSETSIPKCEETILPAAYVRSLVWDGDDLVDWLTGGTRYRLNGETTSGQVNYGHLLDAAISSPDCRYSVLYTKLGTKGVITHGTKFIREINRSYYCAEAYEYPVAIFRARNGRYILAHCPNEYCRLELEDLITGELLTSKADRKPPDFFHSRLAASSDGRYLLSAGWLWHPMDHVRVYDVDTALDDPTHLDGDGLSPDNLSEESSAAFLGDDRLVVALGVDINDEEPPQLRVHTLSGAAPPIITETNAKLGNIMPVGETHLLSFYEYPKLIDWRTGAILKTWPHIASGLQECAIINEPDINPPMALDPARKRCAIADKEKITVLAFK